jgi:nicotinamide mononucleotide transporter PnuC
MQKRIGKRTIYEIGLFTVSVLSVTVAFFLQTGDKNILALITSLCGAAGIIFVAKGMIVGQYVFSVYAVLYAVLSFQNAYYGECILSAVTILPAALIAIVTWTKNPSSERGKVKINKVTRREILFLLVMIVIVTAGVYFLLRALGTAQLVVSTISFVTSFGAAYLLIRRSQYYAVFYVLNDVVLIALWSLAFASGESVLPNVICFVVFFFNDAYGFYDWRRRARLQEKEK